MPKTNNEYGYYSRKLNKPFDSLDELRAAEAADQKAKEEKELAAKAKKEAAVEVETAYKNLNAAKRTYKTELNDALVKYITAMKVIQSEFIADKEAAVKKLSEAENTYKGSLKSFTDKHPEGFHITLRDGDYETTISQEPNVKTSGDVYSDWIDKIFKTVFGA